MQTFGLQLAFPNILDHIMKLASLYGDKQEIFRFLFKWCTEGFL